MNLGKGFLKGFEPETEKFEKNLENGPFLANRGRKFTEMMPMNSIKTITQLVGRHTSMKQTRTHFLKQKTKILGFWGNIFGRFWGLKMKILAKKLAARKPLKYRILVTYDPPQT